MKGYTITLQIYAESEQEAQRARNALVSFIGEHAKQGRAVTGNKIAHAVERWQENPFVRNKIINYFK